LFFSNSFNNWSVKTSSSENKLIIADNQFSVDRFFITSSGATFSSLAGTGQRIVTANASGQLSAGVTPVFADNTAAIAGGLGVGRLYRTTIGLLAEVF
jgi:hypothetical protein